MKLTAAGFAACMTLVISAQAIAAAPGDTAIQCDTVPGIQVNGLIGSISTNGIPLVGSAVAFDASAVKYSVTITSSARRCEQHLVNMGQFAWSVPTVPAGAGLTGAVPGNMKVTKVILGKAGSYVVRFTACPSGCSVILPGQSRATTLPAAAVELPITAVSDYVSEPERSPFLPTLSHPSPALKLFGQAEVYAGGLGGKPFGRPDALCRIGSGGINPQWVTAGPFSGPSDYKLLEGSVLGSHEAGQDNFLNHYSKDFNWAVQPDESSYGLAQLVPEQEGDPTTIRDEMEVEWEGNSIPLKFVPTAGDRTSTVGYWIFDCGHSPYKTEIHPPVGAVTHRPRSIEIPSTFRPTGFPNGLGTNIHVPGVATDILFNSDGGEATKSQIDCRTQLAKPPIPAPTTPGAYVTGPCVGGPNSIRRIFKFNIYLPRDPRARARSLGLSPPAVPVYYDIAKQYRSDPSNGGPEPVVVVRQSGDATWLEVTVDLRAFTGSKYTRRINAAWALPSTNNWGAKRWRIKLNKIHVIDRLEGALEPWNKGDWFVNFNTNNRDQEWTSVFGCNGCVSDNSDQLINKQTGPGGALGPDVELYPGQLIYTHMAGYESDMMFDQDAGTISEGFKQQADNYPYLRPYPTASTDFLQPYYLDMSVLAGPAVGSAALTSQASALLNAYTVHGHPSCGPPVIMGLVPSDGAGGGGGIGSTCGPFGAAMPDQSARTTWTAAGAILASTPIATGDLPGVEAEPELFLTPATLAASLKSMVGKPAYATTLNSTLAKIKAVLTAVPLSKRGDYSSFVTAVKASLPLQLQGSAIPTGFTTAAQASIPRR